MMVIDKKSRKQQLKLMIVKFNCWRREVTWKVSEVGMGLQLIST